MYIEQAFKSKHEVWRYIFIPLGFFGLMALNYLAILLLNIDVESMMETQIAQRGEISVLVELLAPLAIGLGILFLWVKFIHKQSIRSLTTSRKKVDWKRIFFAFSLWGIITSGLIFLDYYLNPEDYVWNFQLEPFLWLLLIGVALIPLQTSFEEYLFRGYLMQGIGVNYKSKLFPLIFTSVLFGMMHIGNPEVAKLGYGILVYYIGTGFFLGIITLMDEGLELALGFHAANNLISALLLTAQWTAFQTPSVLKDVSKPEMGYDVLVPVFVVFPLLILIFAKKYRWSNWKYKLAGPVIPPVEENAVAPSQENSVL
ncbi:CPBP family intramembrane glutamic endopeptidase [Robertkochia solimangrovi]|uniref:CPBP family intramembrane glutamic endopeptidase n=1 Tax=Robertkochia solimangrovi TaxID=2213046 RepID=UPI00117C5C49|nr:CPBP family intramembrane glutamic endopeptidase [Robertkochia solimangrovi]TRZ45400.1 CPBP family intramembrane metalloprotease domain-containing protein [Robertkochia solimangrovi]